MELGKFLHNRGSAVRGTVVDDHDLRVPIALLNATQNFTQSVADAGAFVVSGDNDTDERSFQKLFPKRTTPLIRSRYYATLLQLAPFATAGLFLRSTAHAICFRRKTRPVGYPVAPIHRESVVAVVSDVPSNCCIYYS